MLQQHTSRTPSMRCATIWGACFTSAVLLLIAGMANLVAASGSSAAPPPSGVFTPRGPGGAGGMYSPTFSPYDPDLILLASDMGGTYRSEDAGKTWKTIHFANELRSMQGGPRPVFFADKVVWTPYMKRIAISRDKGISWKTLPDGPWGQAEINQLTALPGDAGAFLVGTTAGVWRTENDGRSWDKVIDGQTPELVALGPAVYTFSANGGFLMSTDGGKTWAAKPVELGLARVSAHDVNSLTGGRDENGTLLLAAVKGVGIIGSRNEGDSWNLMGLPYEHERLLVMAPGQTSVAYAAQTETSSHKQLFKTSDGGRTWKSIFRMAMPWDKNLSGMNVERSWVQTQLDWGYYITARGFAVHPTRNDFLLIGTQGDLYASHDGGESWQQTMSEVLPSLPGTTAPRLRSIGLEVTSAWQYLHDPHDPAREYIAYTDVGFARSLDKGDTWTWSAKGSPWTNTFYDVTFDPDVPGKLYAAASSRHDIPHYIELSRSMPDYAIHANGGIVVSDNYGETWKTPYTPKASGSLPNFTCTTLALDPRSPVDARVLYAGIFGEADDDPAGVYKSVDGGKTWQRKSQGLGINPNQHIYRLRIHPKTGELYCLITGLRGATDATFFNIPGGVWKSSDGGESWKNVSQGSNLVWWTTSLAFDPVDENVMFASACSSQGHWQHGGIYKTTDGGANWKHVLTDNKIHAAAGGDNYEQTMAVALHPDNRNLVYAGTSKHGLLFSRDGGSSWEHYAAFPFTSVQSITFDPRDHNHMILTTFGGGVWSGPHLPPAK